MSCRLLLIALVGVCPSCCAPERLTVPPLPAGGLPASYGDLLTRLRVHSGAANEAFFIDDFDTVSARARDIELTAGYLPKAADAPKAARARIAEEAAQIVAAAKELDDAARARNEDRIREALRKVHTFVRTLPPEEMR